MKKILFALLCSLILVGSANADTYVVKSGDTLYKIGKSFGVSYETIAEDNGITNPNLILVGQRLQVEKKLGYTPVTDYSSRTTQYISATATTIPVASTKDSAGNQIVLSNISTSGTVKVYLNIEPGGTNVEPVICTGLTTTSWTNCSRGIAFQGSSEVSSSSLAKPHNAGSKIIITNIGQFYNQYVSVDGNQQVNDLKTFSSGQIGFTGTRKIVDNGTNLGWTDNGVDTYTFAAGGSGLAASSTKGIGVTDSKIYVNASSTTGMSFDANGALYQMTSSTGGISSDSNGIYTSINLLSDAGIATSTPTAGKIVMASSTGYIENDWINQTIPYGDGSDGDVIISSNTSLTRDTYYKNLVINTGIVLNPNGFKIFVKENLTVSGTGKIASNGNNGSAGTDAVLAAKGTGGNGGAVAHTAGTLPAPEDGKAGGNGGVYSGDPEVAGTAGDNITLGISGVGSAGGAGGAGSNGASTGAGGGAAGTNTAITVSLNNVIQATNLIQNFPTLAVLNNNAGSGGGGGGGGGRNGSLQAAGAGGGGGGSGSTGGFVWLAARNIITNGQQYLEAIGGNGGNGGSGAVWNSGSGGNGGGGGGGRGGVIILIYSHETGAGTKSVAGGTGGNAGTGGNGGENGTSGGAGKIISLQI